MRLALGQGGVEVWADGQTRDPSLAAYYLSGDGPLRLWVLLARCDVM